MKKLSYIFPLSLLLLSCGSGSSDENREMTIEKDSIIIIEDGLPYDKITFEAPDGVTIHANEYKIDDTSPIILLCHQARFNKFEYDGIAERLNENGYNCIAMDQRSGGPIASAQNETNLSAKEQGAAVDYLDAIQDITAAVNYASDKYNQKVILWGSSYSSSLVLWEGMSNDNVKATVSFSPGDYFPEIGSLTDSLQNYSKPFFITSSKAEIPGTEAVLSKVNFGTNQAHFKPTSDGHHGSRALWINQDGGEEYWAAILDFLNSIK